LAQAGCACVCTFCSRESPVEIMKLTVVAVTALALFTVVGGEEVNPLGKVFELMKRLEAEVVKDGEAEAKSYKEYFEWCDSTSKNVANEIKTGETSKAKLTAKITELSSDIEVGDSKIEELASAISSNEAQLKDATAIREKEEADFLASEKELMSTIDTLERAASIISSESAKNPAALAQIDTSSMESLLQSLSVVVDAAGFTGTDQKRLLALAQQAQQTDDDDVGAPAATVYKSHTGGILDLLEDLKDKAETELAEARKTESSAKHNFKMMKQSLDDQMAADTKDMD
jgi:chromosome segregation ATPase